MFHFTKNTLNRAVVLFSSACLLQRYLQQVVLLRGAPDRPCMVSNKTLSGALITVKHHIRSTQIIITKYNISGIKITQRVPRSVSVKARFLWVFFVKFVLELM